MILGRENLRALLITELDSLLSRLDTAIGDKDLNNLDLRLHWMNVGCDHDETETHLTAQSELYVIQDLNETWQWFVEEQTLKEKA